MANNLLNGFLPASLAFFGGESAEAIIQIFSVKQLLVFKGTSVNPIPSMPGVCLMVPVVGLRA